MKYPSSGKRFEANSAATYGSGVSDEDASAYVFRSDCLNRSSGVWLSDDVSGVAVLSSVSSRRTTTW